MIEPRGILLHLHRRESSVIESNSNSVCRSLIIEHDEPERPIHPALEYEILRATTTTDDCPLIGSGNQTSNGGSTEEAPANKWNHKKNIKLILSFVFLVISGTGNVVALKLQSIPMYNYPNFLNIFSHFMYIPICFAYIIPVARNGWFHQAISPEHVAIPRLPFLIMGALDCLASSMQLFSSVYLPGSLLVLLPQAVIPCSMLLSRYTIGTRYTWQQYLGAGVVLLGILIVMEPLLTHRHSPEFYCQAIDQDSHCTTCQAEITEISCLAHVTILSNTTDDSMSWLPQNSTITETICRWLPYDKSPKQDETLIGFWSLVMLASTIPMTISTIYKEVALGGTSSDLDPIYLNGWISIFQFFFSLILAIPAGWLASPSVPFTELPQNMWDGLMCFAGHGTIDSGCHPDACSHHAAYFVALCIVCSFMYTSCMMFVLKYGSCSILFMAQTMLVPIGNMTFSLPFMPQSTASKNISDFGGLAIIMIGLILYKFMDAVGDDDHDEEQSTDHSLNSELSGGVMPWLQEMMQHLREPLVEHGTTPWFQELLQRYREPPVARSSTTVNNNNSNANTNNSTAWLEELLRNLREPLIQQGDI